MTYFTIQYSVQATCLPYIGFHYGFFTEMCDLFLRSDYPKPSNFFHTKTKIFLFPPWNFVACRLWLGNHRIDRGITHKLKFCHCCPCKIKPKLAKDQWFTCTQLFVSGKWNKLSTCLWGKSFFFSMKLNFPLSNMQWRLVNLCSYQRWFWSKGWKQRH